MIPRSNIKKISTFGLTWPLTLIKRQKVPKKESKTIFKELFFLPYTGTRPLCVYQFCLIDELLQSSNCHIYSSHLLSANINDIFIQIAWQVYLPKPLNFVIL